MYMDGGDGMTHKEKAYELLHQQYHCSQALFGRLPAILDWI